MSIFKTVKVEEGFELKRGYDITQKEQQAGEVPVISSSGITSFHNKYKVEGPAVITGRKGTLGKVYYIEDNCWPHDTTLWVSNFKGNNPRYIYYLLKQIDLKKYDVGGANPTLNRNHVHKLNITYTPDINLQKRIADKLSVYDLMIQNNLSRIDKLVEAVDIIYKEWFVNFRFPGYEKYEFVDGKPKKWKVNNVVDSQYFSLIKENIIPFKGEKIYFATGDIKGINIEKEGQIINWDNKPSRAKKQAEKSSVWLARMKDAYKILGFNANMSDDVVSNIVLSTGFMGFRAKEEYYYEYLFAFAKSEYFLKQRDNFATGATQVALTDTSLKKLKYLEPDKDIIIKFSKIINPIINKITLLQDYNKKLEEMQQILIPKITRGEIEV